MSIVSKFLVILVVVVAIGLSVMMLTYVTIQPNYKEAYENAVKQAEAATLRGYMGEVDKFGSYPRTAMELAVYENQINSLKAQLDTARRDAEYEKSIRRTTEQQNTRLEGPLVTLQQELKSTQDLLATAQAAQKSLMDEKGKVTLQLATAEKKSTESEVAYNFEKAKNQTLIAQAKGLDQRIRQLEGAVQKSEAELEKMAAIVQLVKASAAESAQSQGEQGINGLNISPGTPGASNLASFNTGKGYFMLNEPLRIRGKVTEVKNSGGTPYVSINVGEDSKVTLGMTLHVFRLNPPAYIGKMKVTRLDYQKAAGRVELSKPQAWVEVGDELTNDLATLR